jgi:hypothetical protein
MSLSPFIIKYEQNDFPFGFTLPVFLQGRMIFTAYVDDQDAKALAELQKRVGDVKPALVKWAISEVEAGLREGAYADVEIGKILKLEIDLASALELAEQQKECAYQIRQARDLFCLATDAKSDSTAAEDRTGRVQSPTSIALCRACDLPSTDLLCSLLTHPVVIGIRVHPTDPVKRRMLNRAQCDEARPELGANCRPGGNACWRRVVEPEASSPVPRYTTPMLTVALDYLNTVWRLKFGTDRALIRLRSAATTAALETGCSTREEFQSRLSDLADAFNLFDVPAGNLPKESGTIKRLAACLKDLLDSGEMERADRALKTLEAVNETRVAFQHTSTRANLASAFNALGIPSPRPGWGECWDIVRARTAHALTIISTELNRHT